MKIWKKLKFWEVKLDKTYDTQSKSVNFNSRLGYIMVAAGAAIGLGNIWKFPYLAYGGGGGAFVFVYLIVAFIFGHAVVEMETTIGRFAKTNAVDAYGVINKKWKFIGVINVICTFMIDTYYLIVSGYVLHYAYFYLIGGDFGSDSQVYYSTFISNPVKPLIFSGANLSSTFAISSNVLSIVQYPEICPMLAVPR